MNRRSTPASGVAANYQTTTHSSYEPALHPGKRGGGELTEKLIDSVSAHGIFDEYER